MMYSLMTSMNCWSCSALRLFHLIFGTGNGSESLLFFLCSWYSKNRRRCWAVIDSPSITLQFLTRFRIDFGHARRCDKSPDDEHPWWTWWREESNREVGICLRFLPQVDFWFRIYVIHASIHVPCLTLQHVHPNLQQSTAVLFPVFSASECRNLHKKLPSPPYRSHLGERMR